MSQTTFSSLNLQELLLDNLESLGYRRMTPIQAQSLPPILEGRDVIGQGKTGSGKTAAFGLGLLEKLDVQHFRVQALVLCPTRELADQVAEEIRRLARVVANVRVLTLFGGVSFKPQQMALERGVHIVVGTPGRVEEHLHNQTLKLRHLNTLVLDEADRMLDMGFQEAIDMIVDYCPEQRQTLLFSATFPQQIETIASRVMVDPVDVQLAETHDSNSIEQTLFHVAKGMQRTTALCLLLYQLRPDSALVFCNTRSETETIAEALEGQGFSALALHGDMEQRERDEILVRFVNQSVTVLVATDVASRGLDIETLDAVINYQIANELEAHVHRIGRTGRAGRKGSASTLFMDKERYKVQALEGFLGHALETADLPPLTVLKQPAYKSPMVTLRIEAGKKQKLRPGDILGALTGEYGIKGDQVGKIKVQARRSYVAVRRDVAHMALRKLSDDKLKGRSFRVRRI